MHLTSNFSLLLIFTKDTSKVPPPKSNTKIFFSTNSLSSSIFDIFIVAASDFSSSNIKKLSIICDLVNLPYFLSKPYPKEAAVGSFIILRTLNPANSPAFFVASL